MKTSEPEIQNTAEQLHIQCNENEINEDANDHEKCLKLLDWANTMSTNFNMQGDAHNDQRRN